MSNPHPKPSPGRPKGVPNKLTQELKDALMAPFDAKKFKAWADKRPEQYYTLIITKLLPKDINLGLEGVNLAALVLALGPLNISGFLQEQVEQIEHDGQD